MCKEYEGHVNSFKIIRNIFATNQPSPDALILVLSVRNLILQFSSLKSGWLRHTDYDCRNIPQKMFILVADRYDSKKVVNRNFLSQQPVGWGILYAVLMTDIKIENY